MYSIRSLVVGVCEQRKRTKIKSNARQYVVGRKEINDFLYRKGGFIRNVLKMFLFVVDSFNKLED